MTFSIIIPCGRPERLAPLLERLKEQSRREAMEIIVVAATNAPAGLDASDVRWVSVGALFPPGGMRNRGAAAAKGTVLAFIDDDCLPPPNWLEHMNMVLEEEPTRAAVGCRVVSKDPGYWNDCADVALFWSYLGRTAAVRHLGSAALMIRRDAFREVGGFDETLRASEDWELGLRLLAAGWHSWFEPSLQVAHDHRRGGFFPMIKQAYASGFLSGLSVQQRYPTLLTKIGRLTLFAGTPGRYAWLMLPLALVNTAGQVLPLIRTRPRTILFSPFVFFARLAYHIGVWMNLKQERGAAAPVPARTGRREGDIH